MNSQRFNDKKIDIRVSDSLYNVVNKLSIHYKCSKGRIVKMFLETSLIDAKNNNKLTEKLKDEIELYILRNNRKELNNRLYIIKNMYQRVIDMAMSYLFTVGYVNMGAINSILDSFQKEFDCYAKHLKEIVGKDFKTAITNLRDESYLMNNIEKLKLLKVK